MEIPIRKLEPIFERTVRPTKYCGFLGFRVGTCHGLYRETKDAFEILAVVNNEPGNGHFRATMYWFEYGAKREGLKVRVLEVWNFRLRKKLKKHGYRRMPWTIFTLEKSI